MGLSTSPGNQVRILFLLCMYEFKNCVYFILIGSEWSMEEMLAVKFELQRIMTQDTTYLEAVGPGPVSALGGQNFTGAEILARFDGDCKKKDGVCTGDGIDEGKHLHDAVRPDVAKVVRLAFHDCIADSETGGCNG